MRTEVRITGAQAMQHQADLLAAIGADPERSRRTARGTRQAGVRRWLRAPAEWRRAVAA
jgi:hypothetical protein